MLASLRAAPASGWEELPQDPCRRVGGVAPAGEGLGGQQDRIALLQRVGALAELQLQRPVEDQQKLGLLGLERSAAAAAGIEGQQVYGQPGRLLQDGFAMYPSGRARWLG